MKFSIITVCKNAEDVIEQTMKSVFLQTYHDIEYIVIDGLSADRTFSIIQEHKDKISHIISEKDDGIYHAMNKGITIAAGEILYFLNAGDYLYNAMVIEKVAEKFKDAEAKIIYGRAVYKNMLKDIGSRFKDGKYIFDTKMDVARNIIPQQCFFYKKEAFEEVGNFDVAFKISADLDWLLRSLNNNIPNEFMDERFCIYDCSGMSCAPHFFERVRVFRKNMNLIEFAWFVLSGIKNRFPALLRGERFY